MPHIENMKFCQNHSSPRAGAVVNMHLLFLSSRFGQNCLAVLDGLADIINYLLVIDWQDGENDELFISMVDDTTERKVTIPAAFLLGKNG